MKGRTLFRSAIPALIVALVLGSSFVVSAGASQVTNREKEPPGCGYRQPPDKDENQDQPLIAQPPAISEKGGRDNDNCEDEPDHDNEGDGGGGGVNDRGGER